MPKKPKITYKPMRVQIGTKIYKLKLEKTIFKPTDLKKVMEKFDLKFLTRW